MGEIEYYVEFSLEQNCFHIDTLENIKATNLELCERGICNGYVVIAGPVDGETAHKICQANQHLKKGKMDYATKD